MFSVSPRVLKMKRMECMINKFARRNMYHFHKPLEFKLIKTISNVMSLPTTIILPIHIEQKYQTEGK